MTDFTSLSTRLTAQTLPAVGISSYKVGQTISLEVWSGILDKAARLDTGRNLLSRFASWGACEVRTSIRQLPEGWITVFAVVRR